MTTWDFPCSDPADISVEGWASGSIAVSGETTETLTVEIVPSPRSRGQDLIDRVEVGFSDGQLHVRGPRGGPALGRHGGLDLTIRAPAGSSCAARTASAGLSCIGMLSAVSLQTASGDLTARTVTGDVTARTASGDVLVGTVGGDLTVHTASGNTTARQVDGAVRLSAASGHATIGYCAGHVTSRTASGDVHLEAVVCGDIQANSASGDVHVAVVPGIGVYLDLSSLSGSVRSELDETEPGEAAGDPAAVQIKARTLSGDIRVTRSASGRPAADDSSIVSKF